MISGQSAASYESLGDIGCGAGRSNGDAAADYGVAPLRASS